MSKPTCLELLSKVGRAQHLQCDCRFTMNALAARVERVLALHKRVNAPSPWCEHCIGDNPDDRFVTWPCPTVRLLDGEEPSA